MVELVRAGRNADQLAREFKPSATALRHRVEHRSGRYPSRVLATRVNLAKGVSSVPPSTALDVLAGTLRPRSATVCPSRATLRRFPGTADGRSGGRVDRGSSVGQVTVGHTTDGRGCPGGGAHGVESGGWWGSRGAACGAVREASRLARAAWGERGEAGL